MKIIHRFLFFSCFALSLVSCKKDDDCKTAIGINGKWRWVKSVGGIGGNTFTPGTEKKTKVLRIDDFVFREFTDGAVSFESSYQLEVRQDTVWGTNKFIVFENGGEQAAIIDENELMLIDLCFDCFTDYYERE